MIRSSLPIRLTAVDGGAVLVPVAMIGLVRQHRDGSRIAFQGKLYFDNLDVAETVDEVFERWHDAVSATTPLAEARFAPGLRTGTDSDAARVLLTDLEGFPRCDE